VLPGRNEVRLVDVHVGLGLHLLDVGAGGEGLVGPGYDDAADAVVGLEAFERAIELADEGVVQRIERVRAVERDEPDAALRLHDDGLVRHADRGLPQRLRRDALRAASPQRWQTLQK
jgi:hypothetical protein